MRAYSGKRMSRLEEELRIAKDERDAAKEGVVVLSQRAEHLEASLEEV